jgi:hypothetical protein
MTKLRIEYDTSGFPPRAAISNGWGTLDTSWDDILWAAVTVGRPNRQFVFKQGDSSKYEALFRWSLVRMALERHSARGSRLHRTSAARSLDPTEKGAVSYFLGMTFAKLFAAEILNVPWLLHLDVFAKQVEAELRQRSRPDLVGDDGAGNWISVECKGRSAAPDAKTKEKAKKQAKRIRAVGGKRPQYHVATFTYFAQDVLRFEWQDPEPEENEPEPIDIDVPPDSWRYYYGPVLELIRSREDGTQRIREGQFVGIEEADLEVGVHQPVMEALLEKDWALARRLGAEARSGEYRPDGIAIRAGESWSRRLVAWFDEEG